MFKRFVVVVLAVFAVMLLMAQVALAQVAPGEPVSDEQLYALIVGFFLPPALAIVLQTSWSQKAKAVVAFIACLIAGAGTAFFGGDLTGRTWISSALVVLVSAMATYTAFWKPTGIAPKIEKATSFKPATNTG